MVPVDFYYDYISPYSYLAYTQRHRIAAAGGELVHHPFFLGGLLATLRVDPPISRPGKARAEYLMADLERWARRYGVPLRVHPRFPFNTLNLLRGAGLAQAEGVIDVYSQRCFEAVWVEELDVDQLPVARAVAEAAGLDGQAWEDHISRDQVKMQVKADTAAALERGVFGAPTFFLAGEHLFGNDRLDFVVEILKSQA